MKTCTKCKLPKDIEDFYKNKSKPDGRTNECKTCKLKRQKENYVPGMNRDKQLRKYGITQVEFDELFEAQEGLCAVCLKAETKQNSNNKSPHTLSVHHSHKTGKVIALLCNKCNRGIGLLGDASWILHRAARLQESVGE